MRAAVGTLLVHATHLAPPRRPSSLVCVRVRTALSSFGAHTTQNNRRRNSLSMAIVPYRWVGVDDDRCRLSSCGSTKCVQQRFGGGDSGRRLGRAYKAGRKEPRCSDSDDRFVVFGLGGVKRGSVGKKSIVYGYAAGRVCVRIDDGRSPRFRRTASSC